MCFSLIIFFLERGITAWVTDMRSIWRGLLLLETKYSPPKHVKFMFVLAPDVGNLLCSIGRIGTTKTFNTDI